jgi:predicted DNA-binding transcriptional regulator AlpA
VTDQLTISEVAKLVGVSNQSIRAYRVRGTIPAPDGYLGRTPWWERSTIETWLAERPKRGRPAHTK